MIAFLDVVGSILCVRIQCTKHLFHLTKFVLKMESVPNSLEVEIFTDPESSFIGIISDLRYFL